MARRRRNAGGDARLRELERRAADGDVEAMVAHEAELARRGLILEKIRPRYEDPQRTWRQVGGDASPSSYGGLIATHSPFDDVRLINVEPIMETQESAIMDGTYPFPFWSQDAEIDADQLHLGNPAIVKVLEAVLRDGGFNGSDLFETFYNSDSVTRGSIMWEAERAGFGGRHSVLSIDESDAGWSTNVLPTRAELINWWQGESAAEGFHEEDLRVRNLLLQEGNEPAPGYPWDDPVITHLLRGGYAYERSECGAEGPRSANIGAVDCDDCLDAHDDA